MARKQSMRILGIETSCDETAAAIVEVVADSRKPIADSSGRRFAFRVRSNVVASQVQIHAKYGGVVPEVAAREHVTVIIPVIERVLRGIPRESIGGIAVTTGPGLITSLSVGAETARSLAYAWGKPLIAVNHIEGHVMSALLTPPPPLGVRGGWGELRIPRNPSSPPLTLRGGKSSLRFPALALIVSGGHTELLLMRGWRQYECIGATRDDAAGEAFDKVGKLLGLSYPGGPAVAKAAEHGDPTAFDFPRGMLHSKDYEFSFSGLKTAVRYTLEGLHARCLPPHTPPPPGKGGNEKSFLPLRVGGGARGGGALTSDLCASFQAAVVDVLIAKTIAAAQRYRVKTVLLGGGVAANTQLRVQLGDAMHRELPDSRFQIPDSAYTGDNAAMIAAAGGVRLLLGERTRWQDIDVDANWELGR